MGACSATDVNEASQSLIQKNSKTDGDKTKWQKLSTLSNKMCGEIKCINGHEFIMATGTTDNVRTWGIYKYNAYSKEWIEFIKYPKRFEIFQFQLEYDKIKEEIYLYNECHAIFTIIDIKTKQFNSIQFTERKESKLPDACLLNIKGSIHLIGGCDSNQHLVINRDTGSLETIYEFEQYIDIVGASAVYIPSKKCILLIGGRSQIVSDKDNEWINIQIYSLETKQWRMVPTIRLKWYYTYCVLSNDEKHIIITATYCVSDEHLNKILILDIGDNDNEYYLRESKVKLPENGYSPKIVRIGGGLKEYMLIFGYIQRYIDVNTDKIWRDIVMLIERFYVTELLHLFKSSYFQNKNEHYVISLHQVLL